MSEISRTLAFFTQKEKFLVPVFHYVLISQYLVFQQHAKIALRPGDDGIISDIINVLQLGGVTSGSDKLCSNLSPYIAIATVTILMMHASLHIITTQYCSSSQQFTYYYGYEHLVSAFTQSDYSRVFHGLGTLLPKHLNIVRNRTL